MSEQVTEPEAETLEGLDELEQGLTPEQSEQFEDIFKDRVAKVKVAISTDQDKYYQCIAEIHVLLMMFENSMRSMMLNGGPKSILRMLMGRGK